MICPQSQKKGKDWNEVVTTHVLPEHQPTRFSENLNDEDSTLLSGRSEPLHVFSAKCKNRITAHVKELAKTTRNSSVPKRRNPGKAPMSELTNYASRLIFDDTIPEGH